jgi:asparagine synthase (glutamine-hydrolysing)
MLQLIHHRGPDDSGTFIEPGIGLGITRLAIVAPQKWEQPIFNEDQDLCIVFNGEIYNYLALRDELQTLDHSFSTDTDTEVVLHAYEEWGADCLQRFNGMFAFALWNCTTKRLLLARDRLGIKPLYYVYDHPKLIFASEIKALFADPTLPKEPNDTTIYRYLVTGFQKTPATFFKYITELPPGHFMELDGNGLIASCHRSIHPVFSVTS